MMSWAITANDTSTIDTAQTWQAHTRNIMYDLIQKKAAIIMISSDLVEVLKMSDRVAVMGDGRLRAILENDGNLTQQDILRIELEEV